LPILSRVIPKDLKIGKPKWGIKYVTHYAQKRTLVNNSLMRTDEE